jgi:hypothetical protein
MLLILGKIHLRLLPCRDGLYEILYSSGWEDISIKKHFVTVTLVVFSAPLLAWLMTYAPWMKYVFSGLYTIVRNIIGNYCITLRVLSKSL